MNEREFWEQYARAREDVRRVSQMICDSVER